MSAEAARPVVEVSAGNPCPFLRAAVAGGYLDGHVDQLAAVSQLVVDAGAVPAGEAKRVRRATYVIGLIGNGLNPIRLVRNWRRGLTADELRDGPLDKRGAGSRILDASGLVDPRELARIDEFAIDRPIAAGGVERVLGAAQLTAMMDANFTRAVGSRRRFDRKLMDGEWPVLLKVLGANGEYLTVAEISALFVDRKLPDRVAARLSLERG
jgi:hypothetical protein